MSRPSGSRGETYSAQAAGSIANAASTLDVEGALECERRRPAGVSRALPAGRFAGGVQATVAGRAGVFSGLADLRTTVIGRDLGLGEPRVDPYLSGDTTLELAMRRTTAGIFVDTLRLSGDEVEATASGALRSGDGAISATARLGNARSPCAGPRGPG